jgi:non-specific serine/threonine protein kinase
LAIWRELGDHWNTALALQWLGDVALVQEDHAVARSALEESLAIRRDQHRDISVADALLRLANLASSEGDDDRVIALCEESLAVSRDSDDDPGNAASAYVHLAYVAIHRNDLERAAAFARQGLALHIESMSRWTTGWCLVVLAHVAVLSGRAARAARLLGAASPLMGPNLSFHLTVPGARREYERCVDAVRSDLGPTSYAAAFAKGQALTLEQAVAEAMLEDGSRPDSLRANVPAFEVRGSTE